MHEKKLIAIVGPTASGKSELAVKLAKQIEGEIISVDSRQIYCGMDIGTGKVPGKWKTIDGQKFYVYKGIFHHGIDIASPKRQYTVAQFQKYAKKVIKQIYQRGHTPIVCGGTAHWMDAVVYEQKFPEIKPDKKLRVKLANQSTQQLFQQLKRLDPARARTIDRRNPRRLIRALEIVMNTNQPVPKLQQKSAYDVEWLGVKLDQETLYKKIERRFKEWLKQGMLHEIENLHKQGVSWKRLESFGLEYKYGARYLQGQINYDEMVNLSLSSLRKYTKRQMTWWKRNKDIKWIKK
jgi:tRNA dimethylallyltransferase